MELPTEYNGSFCKSSCTRKNDDRNSKVKKQDALVEELAYSVVLETTFPCDTAGSTPAKRTKNVKKEHESVG